jgi:outer membrane lipoprotein SlyB
MRETKTLSRTRLEEGLTRRDLLYWRATRSGSLRSRQSPQDCRFALGKREGRMSHNHRRIAGVLVLTVALGACVAPPMAPTIAVIPGPNKQFSAFAADQAQCQQYATAQTAPQAYAATNQAVGTAILSTALGAGLGAAIGGGRGAAIGAASGAVFGTAVGAGGAGFAQLSLQQQYDALYGQCMSAQGNQLPGFSPPPGMPPYAGAPGPGPYGPPPYAGAPGPGPYGPAPLYPGTPLPPPG